MKVLEYMKHKVCTRVTELLTATILASCVIARGEWDCAGIYIDNPSGHPLKVFSVSVRGNAVADGYLTGHEAYYNAQHQMIAGAGFAQANTGQFLYVTTWCDYTGDDEDNGSLRLQVGMNRIDWADDGKTRGIYSMDKYVYTSSYGTFRILSDVQTPKITNGIVELEVEHFGHLPIEMQFGTRAKPITNITLNVRGLPSIDHPRLPFDDQQLSPGEWH